MIYEKTNVKTQISLLRRMLLIRMFEEKIVEIYPEQNIRCPVHLSIGQEATSAGMCEALGKKDLVVGNHRSHGHYIAKGGDLNAMMAEMFGKETGCCGGIGGSMHLIDQDNGILCTTPIVGGTIPVAVGAALSNRMNGSPVVTTLFVGDGAMEEGVAHESLNFASLHNLPLIVFCENNFYSVYTPIRTRQPERPLSKLAEAHNIKTIKVDGNDACAVYESACEAYSTVREGKGPVFIEATTYRWREHCGPNFDNHIGYRTEEEYQDWKKLCPIERLETSLLASGSLSSVEISIMRTDLAATIDEAVRFAKESPYPSPEKMAMNIYAE